ncbi:MAG: beta-glucuronidase [Prevotella sp.]|nr:beta-glucuronidase [Prevotella sp.]
MKNKRYFSCFILGLVCLASPLSLFSQSHIDLAGQWQSSMGEVTLPGSLLTNNKGNELSVDTRWTGSLYDSSFYYNPYMARYREAGHMKFPFFLTPNRHFVGTVTYERRGVVPREWKKQRVELFLERPHIETTVLVNGREVGHQMSLNTPHVYDLTSMVRPGEENSIAIRVYNGIENVCVGQDSHSVTDQTQGNWNGIAGRIELRARGRQPIGTLQVYPDVSRQEIRVVVSGAPRKLGFLLNDSPVKSTKVNDSTFVLPITKARLWSEFDPYVYRLTAVSKDDRRETTFGMREISIRGRQFYLNGHPIWIRGTVENCTFPLTGYPPTDVGSWETIFRKCKEYGLNMMRFHSYCPPEAAFTAADRIGFYLQPEGPSWPNHGVKLGRGMKIDTYLMDETRRMVEAYGNHPSFVMMAAGNEPAGDWVAWCNRWVDYWKQTDSRRVYCGASVGGGWAWDSHSEYHVKGAARGLNWDRKMPQSTDDYYSSIVMPNNFKPTDSEKENNTPYLSHEQGQWCVFPDLKERSQYTGVYKAYNFDIFADLLRDNGMETQAEKFLHASGKLQTLAYKYEMERNFRTRDYAGFQLLSLNDYSGQGTALVGPLNVFWREKGYVNGDEWREFCSEVVSLARFPKFVYTNDETLEVPVELYNASGRRLEHARATYFIHDGERNEYTHGLLSHGDIPLGKNNEIGTATFPLGQFSAPVKLQFTVVVAEEPSDPSHLVGTARTSWRNTWEFWVYPKTLETATADKKGLVGDLLVTDTLDAKALGVLQRGGKVLITAAGKVRYGNDVKQNFLPVFWNTSWFKMRPPHTTGATIDTRHPLFREFPTDDWGNLNWWELLNRAQVMNLSQLPKDYQPCIQPIDTWHVSRKLGMLIEANVLKGKLLMTTMDITNNLDRRVVARQMRKAILDYMASDDFRPSITLAPETISNFFENEAPAVNMFTKDSPDELKPKIK